MRHAETLYGAEKPTAAIECLTSHVHGKLAHPRVCSFVLESPLFGAESDAVTSLGVHINTQCNQPAPKVKDECPAHYSDSPTALNGTPSHPESLPGRNEQSYCKIRDVNARLGARVDFLTVGAYYRIVCRNPKWIKFEAPRPLRVLYPDSRATDDDARRLGRATEWLQCDTGRELACERSLGGDGVGTPLLSVHRLELDQILAPWRTNS